MAGNRACMFCGGDGLTKEDAWPVWLVRRFQSPGARVFAEPRGVAPRDWPATATPLQLKKVCSSCNNGWMSRLENEAKPVVESILGERLTSIAPSAQSTLATWAVKTAMVLEGFDDQDTWSYSQCEREGLRTGRLLPERTEVLIAKCVDQPSIYTDGKNHQIDALNDAFRARVTTMAFGAFALQVVTIRIPGAMPAKLPVTYDVSDGP